MKTENIAKESITANEDKYRALFESNRDSVTIFRLDSKGNSGHFIEVNLATTELFGFSQKELLAMRFNDLEIISEKEKIYRIKQLLSKGKIDFETIIRDKNGDNRNIEVKAVLINYEGSPAVMNITRDISVSKKIEENSRKTQENLKTILEAIPDLLFEVGYNGKIYNYHSHNKDFLAVPPDEIVGSFFQNILPQEVVATCFSAIEEANENGWSLGKQYSLQLPQGKIWFELSVSKTKETKEKNIDNRFIILARNITERKAIEKALIENEKFLKQTQLIAQLGFYTLEIETGKWISSELLDSIFGIDNNFNRTIESWASIIHPQWQQTMIDYFANEVIGKKENFNKEYQIIRQNDKEVRWVWGNGELIFNEKNEPIKMIGTIQDITERKLAEFEIIKSKEEAEKSREYLDKIINNVGDPLFVKDEQSRILIANDAFCKLFGINKIDIIGKTLAENVSEEEQESFLKIDKQVIADGLENINEETLTIRGGESLTISTRKTRFIDANGKKLIVAVIHDISERKKTEIALRKSEENLQSIFDSVSEAIYVLDENGTFIDVNKGAELMYQLSKSELIGKNPQSVAAPGLNDLNEVNRIIQSVFDNGVPISLEFWSIRKNGEIFPKEVVVNRGKYYGKYVLIVTARDITKRKRNEIALRKSEEKLMNIFNLANSGIILADLNGNFLEFNNWWLKMTGYSQEEFSNLKNLGVTHPDDLEKSKRMLSKLINGEIDKYELEKRYVKKDKTIFWGQTSVSAIKDKNNTITSTIGVVTNITERKLAEELLRESEKKYRGLVENSPDGIITYVNDKITYANDEAIRIVNADNSDQIIGKSVLEFVHQDSLESVIEKMKEIIVDEYASRVVEEKLVSLTGQTVYVELKAIPTLYEKQNAVQVIIHDITEQKQTQDKIKQLSQAVEQSPVAIEITDKFGTIEYVNSKFLETTGYSYDEIIGVNSNILKSGHTSPTEYKKLWDTINSGKEWYGEFHNKKKDGTKYWEFASISPILNSQGITTHYIAIKEDITERKIIEQQLILAKEKAEESDRLKLAFLANMSHEIRTPMNGILGFTELLKEKDLSSDIQQEYINIIEKSGKRMLNIINDIISISKIESGQIEITTSETNINELFDYLTTFFKPEAKHKQISLFSSKALPPNESFIKTDREKLYAILTNLVKNAIKFTSNGSIELGCEKKEGYLEFFVKDSGLGISDSQKNIIFERFRQANDTISRTHEGSGLGLAISKAYVEMQGGHIWVESKEGVGSSFYFTLPFYSEYESKENLVVEKITSCDQEENNIKDLKVLIVEDDAISKLLITIAVKPFSKETLKVSTGYDAIETCRNHPDIDLVMMDINMPEMGGYEATKEIRKFNKDLVIIAQTANGMQSDHDKAIAAGFTDYISKPINISTLSKLICKHFKK